MTTATNSFSTTKPKHNTQTKQLILFFCMTRMFPIIINTCGGDKLICCSLFLACCLHRKYNEHILLNTKEFTTTQKNKQETNQKEQGFEYSNQSEREFAASIVYSRILLESPDGGAAELGRAEPPPPPPPPPACLESAELSLR